ncbi:hypothetical protein CMUS01_11112 [Colletotrichum musicola]|uniref:Uncharacterized protein n=1 Tax=Colletotrichum musicola TaxID=2175873 RepID=A0A8H6K0X3_9PEZI|nr:hypothetical protein CMUS01_11112 [Colletotrichum musicola]
MSVVVDPCISCQCPRCSRCRVERRQMRQHQHSSPGHCQHSEYSGT